jgi:hypothetical protein
VRSAFRTLLFAAVAAAGTILGGWWAVPIVAGLWGWLVPGRHPSRITGLGAALGTAAILGWSASHGPVPVVATRMAAVLQLPGWGFTAVSLAFPALLAACAASLCAGDRQ